MSNSPGTGVQCCLRLPPVRRDQSPTAEINAKYCLRCEPSGSVVDDQVSPQAFADAFAIALLPL